jgi:hypothetical protein
LTLKQENTQINLRLVEIYQHDSLLLSQVLNNQQGKQSNEEILKVLKSLNWNLLQSERKIENELEQCVF